MRTWGFTLLASSSSFVENLIELSEAVEHNLVTAPQTFTVQTATKTWCVNQVYTHPDYLTFLDDEDFRKAPEPVVVPWSEIESVRVGFSDYPRDRFPAPEQKVPCPACEGSFYSLHNLPKSGDNK